jgi:6-phosphogluconolactonase (cycloisomerase 2 family)
MYAKLHSRAIIESVRAANRPSRSKEIDISMQPLKYARPAILLPLFLLLAGCGQFFIPVNPNTPTGNSVYVANATANTIAGFAIGSTALSTLSGSPYTLGVAPSAMAATPTGSYLFVSSLAGAIYGYSVSSSGPLTLLNNGSALVTQISPAAMRVDPSGQWLIVVDYSPTAYIFSIDTTSGALTSQGTLALTAGSPYRITFTPSGSMLFVSLGAGGVDILTFNSTTGVLSSTGQVLNPKASVNADQGMAVDPSGKYLFVAETGVNGIRALSIATTGTLLTELSGSPYATALGPSAVLVDSTGNYVYVANSTANSISAFTLATTGALTVVSGSPFTAGTSPVDLIEDSTNTYIAAACSGGDPDLQIFKIGTTGALTSFATAATGTDPTGAIALAVN